MALLEAKALTREFDDGQVRALRGVDFSVEEGEFIAVTGPSGCGKSTLLQMLGALDRPTSGTLLYRGNSLPDHPNPAAYRAREIGFIFRPSTSCRLSPRRRMCNFRCSRPHVPSRSGENGQLNYLS